MTINVRSNEPVTETPKAPEAKESQSQGQKEQTLSAQAGLKPALQNQESSDSETEETEETESESTDSEESHDDESHEDSEAKDTDKDKPKKKGGFQRRIDKLNARYTDKEREADYWRNLALKNQGAGDSKKEAQGSKLDSPAASEGKPDPERFDTHAEYVEALTDWKTEQKLKERDQKQERSRLENEQAQLIKSHAERVKSFAAKTEDFSDVLSDVDDIPVSPAVREVILQSDNGPELMYELAKNREEYARICKLPPLAAAREMGRLETRIAAQTSGETKAEPKKITKAPKPLAPVGTGGKGSTGKSIFDPGLSQSDYEKLRREQIKRRQV